MIQNLKFEVLEPFLVAERTLKHGPGSIRGMRQGTANISAFYTEPTILIQIGASDFFFPPLCFYTLLFLYTSISNVTEQLIGHTCIILGITAGTSFADGEQQSVSH